MKKIYRSSIVLFAFLLLTELSFSQDLLDNSNGALIQDYLNQKKESFDLSSNDIEDLYINSEHFSKSTKITHLYINQRFRGVKIHNAISSVAIKNNSVFYFTNKFINGINLKTNTTIPNINSQDAIQSIASHLGLGNIQDLQLLSSNDKEFLYASGNISKSDIPVELVFYQTQNGNLKLAWDVSIQTIDGKHWWSIRVDAITSEILDSNDWVLNCNFGDVNHNNHVRHGIANKEKNAFNLFKTNSLLVDGSQYNVFALPVESPNHGGRTLVSEPANITASPFGWHDSNGISGPEFTETIGNNVWAQEDRSGTNATGFSPDGTGTLNFDFPLNTNQPPIEYENVAMTNLFYMNNVIHDIWYQYGFDEESGNFQFNNYGNGGIGGDFVFADAQDGSGLDNANFGTPPDGFSPRMQMFLWSAPSFPQLLTVNSPISLSGNYIATDSNYGGPTLSHTTPITADLVIASSLSLMPTEACGFLLNGAAVSGKIAVIRRGSCNFTDKVQNAQDAGAIGVIMVNSVASPPYLTMGGTTSTITIPAILVSQADGEALIAEIESGGGIVNATLLNNGPYQLDGDFDNGIIAHEYGHGISNRLTGGASAANCLVTCTATDVDGNCIGTITEQMGEGWSDWFALMLTLEPGDLATDIRGMATYLIGESINGNGIRPAPYSTDFAVNNFTYNDTNNTANISAPHGVGFVWATMLWDLTWAYIVKYGFDPDLYNGTGGNNKVMQLVIDGLKLQPCNPGFIDGRNALLAADTATGGEDQCLIWEVFSNRGLGFNASQGSSLERTDQVENFDMPPNGDPSLANCTSLGTDEFDFNNYKIYPNPTNDKLFIKTSKSLGMVTMSLTDINGRIVISKNVDLFGEVGIDISNLQSGMYILNMKGKNIDTNDKILKY